MRKRTIAFIVNVICLFLVTFLQFLDPSDLNTSYPLFIPVFKFLIERKLLIVVVCALYVSVYSLIPVALYTKRTRNELKRKFLTRIFTELLVGDPDLHRVTLFKEVCYARAIILNYLSLIRHLFCDHRWRWRLYLSPPKYGRYLIVNERLGQHYQRTSTMFRIAKNSIYECNGLAGLIRYKGTSVCLSDLPDLSDINFQTIGNLSELRGEKRKRVETYMNDGFIKDFDALKKIHRASLHFYGTVITKNDGSYWGVLLIDSISPVSPFTEEVQKRFNSFAISISDIINLEV